ncbi:hypothetical protein K474DRAFT_1600699 [Panus rudis PR-1116 ss-1]|nr:hypothetical protein K474DRAFT_1600699 [Panus rudis PR-1116 ss-1]
MPEISEPQAEYIVRESSASTIPRVKPRPKQGSAAIPVPFEYTPSDDGTDENLLILLHGLGDTHVPFGKLGKQLKLPQTATLAIRAPEQIPFLYEQAYQWYTSFDPLGDLITRPNPTPALELLDKVLKHLMTECQWPPERIHFFGFAQGGTVAAEYAYHWWQAELTKEKGAEKKGEAYSAKPLGTIVTVSGPLISWPTPSRLCPTPVLVVHRPTPSPEALPNNGLAAFKKGFSHVVEAKLSARGQGMPRGKEEMEPIMRFWSEVLSRRQTEGLYEVMSGAAPVS